MMRIPPALRAFLIYTAVVVFLYKDVVLRLSSRVLAGSQVGGMFVWDFWWFRTSLSEGKNPFFTTFVMFPEGTDLVLYAPLVQVLGALLAGFSPHAAVNLLFLSGYVASGMAMYHLARRFVMSEGGRFLAGFVFMFNQYSLTQIALGHLGEFFLFFLPLVFLFGHDTIHGGPKWSRLFLVLAMVGIVVSTPYLAFACLGLGLPVYVAAEMVRSAANVDKRMVFKTLAVGYLAAAATAMVVYYPMVMSADRMVGGSESSVLSLLSFFDFPAWHPTAWVQSLRQATSGALDAAGLASTFYLARVRPLLAKPEDLMGFFGISVLLMVLAGVWTGVYRGRWAWVALFCAGLLFAMGPWLQVAYAPTAIPMPYLLFDSLPITSLFRTPSRLVVLSWMAVAIGIGLSYEGLHRRFQGRLAGGLLIAAFLVLYSWEMGLSAMGRIWTPVSVGPIERLLAEDKAPTGLLELPVSINKKGDITINAQRFMLFTPLRQKPLVVGRPTRHSRDSLSFCQNTDVVYELTHPASLALLTTDPELAIRRAHLVRSAKKIFQDNNVRYVLLHGDDVFFSDRTVAMVRQFLRDAFGAPTLTEGQDELYRSF